MTSKKVENKAQKKSPRESTNEMQVVVDSLMVGV